MKMDDYVAPSLLDSMDTPRIQGWHQDMLSLCRKDVQAARNFAFGGCDEQCETASDIVQQLVKLRSRVRFNCLLVVRTREKRESPYPDGVIPLVNQMTAEMAELIDEVDELVKFVQKLCEEHGAFNIKH